MGESKRGPRYGAQQDTGTMDFREVDSPFFDKEGKGSSDAEPEADGLRSRGPNQVYVGELDKKQKLLF